MTTVIDERPSDAVGNIATNTFFRLADKVFLKTGIPAATTGHVWVQGFPGPSQELPVGTTVYPVDAQVTVKA